MPRNDNVEFSSPVTILVFAFRYALGRKTMASLIVVDDIVKNWDSLPVGVKEQIKREITEAIARNDAGMQCDTDQWQRVLDLPITSKETG